MISTITFVKTVLGKRPRNDDDDNEDEHGSILSTQARKKIRLFTPRRRSSPPGAFPGSEPYCPLDPSPPCKKSATVASQSENANIIPAHHLTAQIEAHAVPSGVDTEPEEATASAIAPNIPQVAGRVMKKKKIPAAPRVTQKLSLAAFVTTINNPPDAIVDIEAQHLTSLQKSAKHNVFSQYQLHKQEYDAMARVPRQEKIKVKVKRPAEAVQPVEENESNNEVSEYNDGASALSHRSPDVSDNSLPALPNPLNRSLGSVLSSSSNTLIASSSNNSVFSNSTGSSASSNDTSFASSHAPVATQVKDSVPVEVSKPAQEGLPSPRYDIQEVVIHEEFSLSTNPVDPHWIGLLSRTPLSKAEMKKILKLYEIRYHEKKKNSGVQAKAEGPSNSLSIPSFHSSSSVPEDTVNPMEGIEQTSVTQVMPPSQPSIQPLQSPPAQAPSSRSASDTRVKPACRNLIQGHCRFGSKCRFNHDPDVVAAAIAGAFQPFQTLQSSSRSLPQQNNENQNDQQVDYSSHGDSMDWSSDDQDNDILEPSQSMRPSLPNTTQTNLQVEQEGQNSNNANGHVINTPPAQQPGDISGPNLHNPFGTPSPCTNVPLRRINPNQLWWYFNDIERRGARFAHRYTTTSTRTNTSSNNSTPRGGRNAEVRESGLRTAGRGDGRTRTPQLTAPSSQNTRLDLEEEML